MLENNNYLYKNFRNTGRGGRFNREGGHYRGKLKSIIKREKYQEGLNKTITKEILPNLFINNNLHHAYRAYIDPELSYAVGDSGANITYKAYIDPELSYAVGDSGASIAVTNIETVKHFELTPQIRSTPITLTFGNNTTAVSTHYAYFGAIIGNISILDNAPDTLLSISTLCNRGFTITFTADNIHIFLQKQLIYTGYKDKHTELYYINMKDLIDCKINLQKPLAEKIKVNNVNKHKETHKRNKIISQSLIKEVLWLHKCMGHQSRNTMCKAVNNQSWPGVSKEINTAVINKIFKHIQCTACAIAKRNKLPRELGIQILAQLPGEIISYDYQGKISSTSIRGYTGFYIFKCQCTGFRHIFLVKDKSSKTLKMCINEILDYYNIHGHVVRKFRFDAGSTENSKEIIKHLHEQKIQTDPAAKNSQFQNPVEREVQTVIKGVSALLIDQSSLSAKYWDYALESWVETANNSPMTNDITPIEAVTDIQLDIPTTFRLPFGCPVTCTKEEGRDVKFDTISEVGIAVGTSGGSNKAIKVIIPSRGLAKSYERVNVEILKNIPDINISSIEKEKLNPEILPDESIIFKSAALDLKTSNIKIIGNLGTSLFNINELSDINISTLE